MDTELAELKAACERYRSSAKSDVVGALDWAALLMLLPIVLNLFVKDAALRDVITKVIALLRGLFSQEAA